LENRESSNNRPNNLANKQVGSTEPAQKEQLQQQQQQKASEKSQFTAGKQTTQRFIL